MKNIAHAFSYMSTIIQNDNCSNKFTPINWSIGRNFPNCGSLYLKHIFLRIYDNVKERKKRFNWIKWSISSGVISFILSVIFLWVYFSFCHNDDIMTIISFWISTVIYIEKLVPVTWVSVVVNIFSDWHYFFNAAN